MPHPPKGFKTLARKCFYRAPGAGILFPAMGCLIGCLALFTPRLAIVLVVIFSNYIGQAYETFLWPCLGFLFMPFTTLAYAWAVNSHGTVTGIYLVVVVFAVLLDLGFVGGSGASARRRRGEWS